MKAGGKRVVSTPLLLRVFLFVILVTWLELIWIVGRVEIQHENDVRESSPEHGVNSARLLHSAMHPADRITEKKNRLTSNAIKAAANVTGIGSSPYNDHASHVGRRWRVPAKPDPTVARHLSFAWRHYQNASQEMDTENVAANDFVLRNLVTATSCNPTSQIELFLSNDDGTTWNIQSFDAHGNPKSEGGDEFYITYHAPHKKTRAELVFPEDFGFMRKRDVPLAIAHVIDNDNGTYLLDFVQSPLTANDTTITSHPNNYVTVYLDYTCGIGKIAQPLKKDWFTGGMLMTEWTIENVTQVPTVRSFQRPNQDGRIDLGQYDQILCFGDSNVRHVVEYLSFRMANGTSNLHLIGETQHPLQESSLNRKFLPKTLEAIEAALKGNATVTPPKKLAIMVGSNTWDVVFGVRHGAHYEAHLEACRQWVKELRKAFPAVDVYWFPGYALHVHVAGLVESNTWPGMKPLKYMSYYRSFGLYTLQRDLMHELNVPLIDIYEASFLSAEKTLAGDARHYLNTFVAPAIGWYYKTMTVV